MLLGEFNHSIDEKGTTGVQACSIVMSPISVWEPMSERLATPFFSISTLHTMGTVPDSGTRGISVVCCLPQPAAASSNKRE